MLNADNIPYHSRDCITVLAMGKKGYKTYKVSSPFSNDFFMVFMTLYYFSRMDLSFRGVSNL